MTNGLPDSRPIPRAWQLAAGVIAAVLLVVGVGLLIARAAGFSEVRDAIEQADSTWFAACLAAQLLALGAYADVFRGAFRWRGGPDPGFRLSAEVMLASVGATRVFAAGGVGAIAATYCDCSIAPLASTAEIPAIATADRENFGQSFTRTS